VASLTTANAGKHSPETSHGITVQAAARTFDTASVARGYVREMAMDPMTEILYRTAVGMQITGFKVKKANADATLGLLKLLAPIRRLVDRIKGADSGEG